MVTEVAESNVNQLIEGSSTLIVDFWAPWCGPCRSFKPVFEKAATAHPEITFAACNTEAQPELAGAFGIRSIPTVMVFREGVLLYSQPGALPAAMLDHLLGQVQALDMGEVRARIADQQAKAANA